MEVYLISLSRIILLVGSFAFAGVIIYFGWSLVFYATSVGDDLERAHAKMGLVIATLMAAALMVLWWLVSSLGSALGL